MKYKTKKFSFKFVDYKSKSIFFFLIHTFNSFQNDWKEIQRRNRRTYQSLSNQKRNRKIWSAWSFSGELFLWNTIFRPRERVKTVQKSRIGISALWKIPEIIWIHEFLFATRLFISSRVDSRVREIVPCSENKTSLDLLYNTGTSFQTAEKDTDDIKSGFGWK